MRELEVWLNDDLVGYLTENRKGGRFRYTSRVEEVQLGNPLLSLSLPVKSKSYGESKTENWFMGLLPEGKRRQEVAQSLGLSEHDWIGLLAEIGWECAGAVRVFEAGKVDSRSGFYEQLTIKELATKLSDVSVRMPQQGTDDFRMSLGGFQEKMCVMMPELPETISHLEKVEAYLPLGDAPSTHILKPEDTQLYPGCAESEAWAMQVAGCATRCSRIALLQIEGAPDTLVVERYDRKRDVANRIQRIHQEDACQALGLPPHNKYAAKTMPKGDDPTYKAMADLLLMYAADPLGEQCELLRQMVVNCALGNWDAHAKNTSFLFTENATVSVAPMYDVVPIAEIEPRTTVMSLRINGKLDPILITRADIIAEAMSWGITPTLAEDIIATCLDDLKEGLNRAAIAYPQAARRHEAAVIKRIERLR